MKNRALLLAGLLLAAVLVAVLLPGPANSSRFDGERAYVDVLAQVAFGPRVPGSPAHQQAIDYILCQLTAYGWQAELQEVQWNGFLVRNILAVRTDGEPGLILGAHYDSRARADRETEGATAQPVPGANDGASGVAVLLELARILPGEAPPVMLAFFDQEDNGGLDGREWIMGSRAFAARLGFRPQAVVIVDMVGDAQLTLPVERTSDPSLAATLWAHADRLGVDQFIAVPGSSILDDHVPFLELGIPAVDIIDFDYPYWHTSLDTPDKVSAQSLQAVGDVLYAWIMSQIP